MGFGKVTLLLTRYGVRHRHELYGNSYLEISEAADCQRWFEQLNENLYVIRHCPGSQMAQVDALSRAPCDKRQQVVDSEYELEEPEEFSTAAVHYTVPLEDKISMI